MASRAARPAAARLGRLRHGLPDGARDRARGGAASRARGGRLGPRSATASRARRASGCSRARNGTSRSTGHFVTSASARPRSKPIPADGQGRMDTAPLRAALAGRGRADDRLRAGRQREYGLVRSAPDEIADAVDGHGRLAARRWCVRALGRRLAAVPPPRRRRRAGRLVGDGRAQVAERPLRLRDRLLRASRLAPSSHGRPCKLPRAGRWGRGPRPDGLGPRSSRAARAASRSMPRSARSAATGSRR